VQWRSSPLDIDHSLYYVAAKTDYRLQPLASPTPRQRQVLECIISYIDDNGYPPSQGLKLRSTGTVVKHLKSLDHLGYIRRSSVSRSIVLAMPTSNSMSVPILGTVRAGYLSQAIEDIHLGDLGIWGRENGPGGKESRSSRRLPGRGVLRQALPRGLWRATQGCREGQLLDAGQEGVLRLKIPRSGQPVVADPHLSRRPEK